MAALIEFVCVAPHQTRGEPSITLEQRAWAYCSLGASEDHQWTRIEPTGIEALRAPAGNARTRLVPGDAAGAKLRVVNSSHK